MSFSKMKRSYWNWSLLAACTLFGVQAVAAQNLENRQTNNVDERRGTVTFFNKPGSLVYSNFDDSNGVILFRARLEGREIIALLDTGSDYSLISESIVDELKLSTDNVTEDIQTTNSSQLSERVSNVKFEHIGQYSMVRDFYTFNFSGISRALGSRVDAIIGYDLLRQLSFVLDGKSKRLLFLPAGMISPKDERYAIVELENGVFNGTLNGKETRFAVDLGSNNEVSVYNHAWATVFGNQRLTTRGSITDASGITRLGQGVDGVHLNAFGASADVFVTQKPRENDNFDALVGYPLFNGRITVFDYSNNKIYFEKEP